MAEIKITQEDIDEYKGQNVNLLNAPIETLKRSGTQFGKDVITPFIEPVKTAKSIYALGKSLKNLLFVEGQQDDEVIAQAMGDFLKKRYGSLNAVKDTALTDPVGFVADLSMILSLGGTAGARVPGIAGKTANIVQQSGKIIDPVRGAAVASGLLLKPLGYALSIPAGLTTGAGGKAIRTAYGAGVAGGDKAKTFREAQGAYNPVKDVGEYLGIIEKNNPQSQMIAEKLIKEAENIKINNIVKFHESKKGAELQKLKIKVPDINNIITKYEKLNKIQGMELNPLDSKILNEIKDIKKTVFKAKQNQNGRGADLLVHRLNDLANKNKKNNGMILAIKNEIRNEINNKMPNYINLTKNFEELANMQRNADDIIKSGNPDKIIKIMKDSFIKGDNQKKNLIQNLDKKLNLNINEAVAGEKLKNYLPSGGVLNLGNITRGLAVAGGATKGLGPVAAIFSPRVMGSTAYGIGRAKKPLVEVLRGSRALQSTTDDELYM